MSKRIPTATQGQSGADAAAWSPHEPVCRPAVVPALPDWAALPVARAAAAAWRSATSRPSDAGPAAGCAIANEIRQPEPSATRCGGMLRGWQAPSGASQHRTRCNRPHRESTPRAWRSCWRVGHRDRPMDRTARSARRQEWSPPGRPRDRPSGYPTQPRHPAFDSCERIGRHARPRSVSSKRGPAPRGAGN